MERSGWLVGGLALVWALSSLAGCAEDSTGPQVGDDSADELGSKHVAGKDLDNHKKWDVDECDHDTLVGVCRFYGDGTARTALDLKFDEELIESHPRFSVKITLTTLGRFFIDGDEPAGGDEAGKTRDKKEEFEIDGEELDHVEQDDVPELDHHAYYLFSHGQCDADDGSCAIAEDLLEHTVAADDSLDMGDWKLDFAFTDESGKEFFVIKDKKPLRIVLGDDDEGGI